MAAKSFVVMAHHGEGPFASVSTWRTIWDKEVTIIVSIITSVSKA